MLRIDLIDTSGYNPNQPLPVGLNKKVIGLMKDELGGEIMTEFVTSRPIKLGNQNLRNAKESRNVSSARQ